MPPPPAAQSPSVAACHLAPVEAALYHSMLLRRIIVSGALHHHNKPILHLPLYMCHRLLQLGEDDMGTALRKGCVAVEQSNL